MRISNIKHYLGGADQVIAREVLQGNSFLLNVDISDTTVNFSDSAITFDIKSELFTSTITEKRSCIKVNTLTKESTATVVSSTKTQSIINAGISNFDYKVPTTLLSDFGAFNASPDSATPYIVVTKVQWTIGTEVKSIRFMFVVRYQPQ